MTLITTQQCARSVKRQMLRQLRKSKDTRDIDFVTMRDKYVFVMAKSQRFYILNKMKRYIYTQCMLVLKHNDNLQILFYSWMNTSLQSLENEYHDKNLKIRVQRSVRFQEGSKFENASLRYTLKGLFLLRWLTRVRLPFLRHLLVAIW